VAAILSARSSAGKAACEEQLLAVLARLEAGAIRNDRGEVNLHEGRQTSRSEAKLGSAVAGLEGQNWENTRRYFSELMADRHVCVDHILATGFFEEPLKTLLLAPSPIMVKL